MHTGAEYFINLYTPYYTIWKFSTDVGDRFANSFMNRVGKCTLDSPRANLQSRGNGTIS